MQQYYSGIKIEFGEVVISSVNRNARTVNGKVYELKNFGVTPILSDEKTLEKALEKLNSEKFAWQDELFERGLKSETKNERATYKPKGQLVIIDKDLFNDKFEPVLVYKFDIYSLTPFFRDYIYVNANTGEIVFRNSIIKHVKGTASTRYSGTRTIETQQNGSTYRLKDTSRGSGIETYNLNRSIVYNPNGSINYDAAVDFTDNDNNWTSSEYQNANKDDAALDAHWGATKTYDYFLEKHNRNSYDNKGSIIRSYIHFGINADVAFWDGNSKYMAYGDGAVEFDALTSLDVVAHEIGHGICSHTANLVYANEPGAINEGLSDIWGAMVEFYAAPEKQTYSIGEDIKRGGNYLRSMSNPGSVNHPDTYKGTYWHRGSDDEGGIHTNNGVLNYWFYLLAEGGSGTNDVGNSFNVQGVGKEKAAKIVYRAESAYFTSTTNYAQARELTMQATEDLYGKNSIERTTVCQSWYAVNIGDNNCLPQTKINGNNVVCNASNSSFHLSNYPLNLTTNWNVSSNLQIISQNNTGIIVKAINSSSNGTGKITANILGNIVSKTIWTGIPEAVTELSHVAIFGCTEGEINAQGGSGAEQYEWIIGGGIIVNPPVNSNRYTGQAVVFVDPSDGSYGFTVRVRAKNSCGHAVYFTKNIPTECSPNSANGGGKTYLFSLDGDPKTTDEEFIVYPNPVHGRLYVFFPNDSEKKLNIFSMDGKLIISYRTTANRYEIDVSNFSNGVYILHSTGKEKNYRKILIKNNTK